MIPEDIERLIGGYATGTLSEEERRKLFEAALDDQDLFDALQGEHALKQLLDDPVSREMVRRAAAGPVSQTGTSRFLRGWVWAVAGVGAVAAAVLVISFVELRQTPKPPAEIAQIRREVSPARALPAAPPSSDAVTALAPEHKLKAKRLENAPPSVPPPPPSVPPPQSSAGQLAPQIVGGFGGQDQMQAPAPSFRASGTQPQQNALRSAPLAASARSGLDLLHPIPKNAGRFLSRRFSGRGHRARRDDSSDSCPTHRGAARRLAMGRRASHPNAHFSACRRRYCPTSRHGKLRRAARHCCHCRRTFATNGRLQLG